MSPPSTTCWPSLICHVEALCGGSPNHTGQLGVVVFHRKIVMAVAALIYITDFTFNQHIPEIRFQQLFDLIGDIADGGYIKRERNLVGH